MGLASRTEPPVDLHRTVSLALVHDAPEALTGDLPRSASRRLPEGAKAELERRAAEDLLAPLGAEPRALFEEYAAQETREARLARLADKLQLGLRLLGYVREGRRGLDEFRAGLRELDCAEFPCADELKRAILAELE